MLTSRNWWSAHRLRRLCTTTLGHGSTWHRHLAHGNLCWLDFKAEADTVPRYSRFWVFYDRLEPSGRGTPDQHSLKRAWTAGSTSPYS